MSVTQAAPESNKGMIAGIIALSIAATLFLFWLIYVHTAPQAFATRLLFLPALDALLNGLAAICLIVGFFFILRRNIKAHRRSMITAFVFSSIFLVSYIVNHALHGDVLLPGPRPAPRRLFFHPHQPHCAVHCRAAYGAHHVLLLAYRALSAA